MPAKQAENPRYFQEEFTQETFVFLANLLSFNLDSRRLMANGILNALYTPVKNRDGDFSKLDDLDRTRLLNLTTLEILAKVYMALEDLGKILVSARRRLPEFAESFVTLEQKRSLSAFAELARRPERDLCSIFPLWKPERYRLVGYEARTLAEYNQRVAKFSGKVLPFIAEFVERHNAAYNRYKHGMPVMVGLEAQSPAVGIDGLVGIIRDGKDVKNAGFMLVGDKVVEKFIGFIDDVVFLSKVLVQRRLQMAELGGTPPPVLCRSVEKDTSIEYQTILFGGIDEHLQRRVIPILDKVLQPLKRTRITVTVKADIERQKLQDWADFYRRDWRIT